MIYRFFSLNYVNKWYCEEMIIFGRFSGMLVNQFFQMGNRFDFVGFVEFQYVIYGLFKVIYGLRISL